LRERERQSDRETARDTERHRQRNREIKRERESGRDRQRGSGGATQEHPCSPPPHLPPVFQRHLFRYRAGSNSDPSAELKATQVAVAVEVLVKLVKVVSHVVVNVVKVVVPVVVQHRSQRAAVSWHPRSLTPRNGCVPCVQVEFWAVHYIFVLGYWFWFCRRGFGVRGAAREQKRTGGCWWCWRLVVSVFEACFGRVRGPAQQRDGGACLGFVEGDCSVFLGLRGAAREHKRTGGLVVLEAGGMGVLGAREVKRTPEARWGCCFRFCRMGVGMFF
jgi:hypothetical protein